MVLVDGPEGLVRCLARDISPVGLYLESPVPYPTGTLLRITFAIPDGTWEMTSRCVLVRSTSRKTPAGTRHGLALDFVGVEVEADDLISAARRAHA